MANKTYLYLFLLFLALLIANSVLFWCFKDLNVLTFSLSVICWGAVGYLAGKLWNF